MLTAGSPARSSRIPSARLAALQEPQSPIPATTKSHRCRICWIRLSSTGVPKYPFWNITNSRTPYPSRSDRPTSDSSTDAFGLALSSSPAVSPRRLRSRGASVVSTARSLAPVGSSSFSRISVSPALLHDSHSAGNADRHLLLRQYGLHREPARDLLQPKARARARAGARAGAGAGAGASTGPGPGPGARNPPQQRQVGDHDVHA